MFQTFHTPRLLLRKLTPEDYKHIFTNWSKPEICEFLGLQSDEEFEREKGKSDGGYNTYRTSMVYFQIILKDSNKVIGGCGFHNWRPDHHRAEIGYMLKEDADKNKGYMSEVVKAVIDYGFREMGLHRIEALVGPENVPSLKLMEKFHFQREGQLREHFFINNRFEDSVAFSLLKSEYEELMG